MSAAVKLFRYGLPWRARRSACIRQKRVSSPSPVAALAGFLQPITRQFLNMELGSIARRRTSRLRRWRAFTLLAISLFPSYLAS